MSTGNLRYNTNPMRTDTSGFFGHDVLYNPVSDKPVDISRLIHGKYQGWHAVAKQGTSVAKETVSIFAPHELKITNQQPLPRTTPPTDWVAGILILCLLILAVIQVTVPRRLQQVFRSVALPYYVNQLEREGNLLSERMSFSLGFVYLTSLSLLLYRIAVYFVPGRELPFSGWVLFMVILGICIMLYVLKILAMQFTGTVFKTTRLVHDYLVNNMIFNVVTGIILFPAVMVSLYINDPVYIWISCGIVTILLVYRFIRGFIIGLSNTKYSVFYLFLYLCTLEILPLLLIYKAVIQH